MAIRTFKEIIENKGYRINAEDRKIFEDSDIQSFFGISQNDYIEFVLYDINDNQLNQKNYGGVRYIPLTSENIRDYFLIADGTVFQKYKFPSEYFIDVKLLIKEAGYNAGIFKTQVTLINKRLGSDREFDKVWIQEISPSRTEIRVIAHKKGLDRFPELAEQYNAFVNDLDFRDDTIRNTFEYIEQINPNVISTYLKSIYSEKWVQKMIQEYNIKDLDLFSTNIYQKFLQSVIFEFTNRISDINDLNYGKPKTIRTSVTLSKQQIKTICERLLIGVINKLLLVPNVNFGSKINEKIESVEEIEKIMQAKTSSLAIDTKLPQKKISTLIKPNPDKPSDPENIKAIEIVRKDIIKNDVIIPEEEILAADNFKKPRFTVPEENIVEPKSGFFRRRNFVPRNRPDGINNEFGTRTGFFDGEQSPIIE